MRLLILTQAVDLDDPVLGFFHAWVEALAPHCKRIHVVCLKEGPHQLPNNVSVHSLGKESGRSRMKYIARFYRYIIALSGEHDAVLVHMNSEYVILGGWFWRLTGKRVILWRNHKRSGVSTWLAAHLSHTVCYTSPSAYVARFKNALKMPLGIDTKVFSPSKEAPDPRTILFFGRLDEVKRPHLFIEAIEKLHERGVSFNAEIIGDPTHPESAYAQTLRERAAALILEGVLSLHESVSHTDAPALFARHAVYVNLTPSGSFDKTIGEAMATGCLVVADNDAIRDVFGARFISNPTSADIADALQAALTLSEHERRAAIEAQRVFVEREHSLALLVSRLAGILTA